MTLNEINVKYLQPGLLRAFLNAIRDCGGSARVVFAEGVASHHPVSNAFKTATLAGFKKYDIYQGSSTGRGSSCYLMLVEVK